MTKWQNYNNEVMSIQYKCNGQIQYFYKLKTHLILSCKQKHTIYCFVNENTLSAVVEKQTIYYCINKFKLMFWNIEYQYSSKEYIDF